MVLEILELCVVSCGLYFSDGLAASVECLEVDVLSLFTDTDSRSLGSRGADLLVPTNNRARKRFLLDRRDKS